MMAGLAHESGNALQRSQACLETAAWRCRTAPRPSTCSPGSRRPRTISVRLYEEVRGYAGPVRLERRRVRPGRRLARGLGRTWRRSARAATPAACEDVPASTWSAPSTPSDWSRSSATSSKTPWPPAATRCGSTVALRAKRTSDGQPGLRVAVRDNGPGLTPEQRQRIFEPFFTTKTKGTGLGMAIAKRIVEAHGGQIAVGAGAGPGAEILITLPRGVP